jgi:hypothetical protein
MIPVSVRSMMHPALLRGLPDRLDLVNSIRSIWYGFVSSVE